MDGRRDNDATRGHPIMEFKHVALRVPDLQQAEEHYRTIFDAELVGRESLAEDGKWYSAPHGSSWDEIRSAGVEINWVGLRCDDLVIALLEGRPAAQQTLYCIGLTLTPAELAGIHQRLPGSTTVEVHSDTALTFVDRYGFRWQCFGPGFMTAGDARGDWLAL